MTATVGPSGSPSWRRPPAHSIEEVLVAVGPVLVPFQALVSSKRFQATAMALVGMIREWLDAVGPEVGGNAVYML